MAAASNTAVSVQSPRAAGDGGAAAAGYINSPKSSSRRSGRSGSPWTTPVVRAVGVEEPVVSAAAPGSPRIGADGRMTEESDDYVMVEGVDNGSGGGGGAKKPAWNRPSNGVVEVGPVMGAVSWPALGEATKASPKSSSSDSLKTLSDAALPALQVVGNQTSSSHKQVAPNNANPSSAPNPAAPTRQRSMKRGVGSSSGSANGGSSQVHSPQPQDSMGEIPPNNIGGKHPPSASESSPRDRDHSHKSHGGNEQQHQRNSFRRGNGGSHPRADGSYHHSYGGKRDQDRGNQEWNPHNRGFVSRDAHMQPQRGFTRGYPRPVHNSPAFIAPPVAVRPPFGNPMYSDVAPPLIYVGPPPPAMPMVAPIPPGLFFPVVDPQLHAKIVNQIDYYFSNENLVKDLFLRQNMDDQGWVPIKLIAGFKKVTYLTENIPLILEAMRSSSVVEVQGDKVRRRNDWNRWLMLPPAQYTSVSSPQVAGNSSDMLGSGIQGISLDEKTLNHGVENQVIDK